MVGCCTDVWNFAFETHSALTTPGRACGLDTPVKVLWLFFCHGQTFFETLVSPRNKHKQTHIFICLTWETLPPFFSWAETLQNATFCPQNACPTLNLAVLGDQPPSQTITLIFLHCLHAHMCCGLVGVVGMITHDHMAHLPRLGVVFLLMAFYTHDGKIKMVWSGYAYCGPLLPNLQAFCGRCDIKGQIRAGGDIWGVYLPW